MAYEEEVFRLMSQLVIADKHIIASLMTQWKQGTSAVNNTYKTLESLVGLGKLVKGVGYYKLPDCKSEYKEHAQLLTQALTEILKLKLNTKIFREHTIDEVGLRPDAIILITHGTQGLCFILEVCINEAPEYLTKKINVWNHWEGAKPYLSKLLETKIKAFDLVVLDGLSDGAFEFNAYLKGVKDGSH